MRKQDRNSGQLQRNGVVLLTHSSVKETLSQRRCCRRMPSSASLPLEADGTHLPSSPLTFQQLGSPASHSFPPLKQKSATPLPSNLHELIRVTLRNEAREQGMSPACLSLTMQSSAGPILPLAKSWSLVHEVGS